MALNQPIATVKVRCVGVTMPPNDPRMGVGGWMVGDCKKCGRLAVRLNADGVLRAHWPLITSLVDPFEPGCRYCGEAEGTMCEGCGYPIHRPRSHNYAGSTEGTDEPHHGFDVITRASAQVHLSYSGTETVFLVALPKDRPFVDQWLATYVEQHRGDA